MRHEVCLGVDPDMYRVLGGVKYYPEWQSTNASLYNPFEPATRTDETVNTVFTIPYWDYYVDEARTPELIWTLADQD